jgi:hypothetical protein
MSEENKFSKNEFAIISQLIDGGIRAAGINVAQGGNELISGLQKFFQLRPEEEATPEPEPDKE